MQRRNKTIETTGNVLLVVLVVGFVLAYAADLANRTESRLAARMAR